MLLVRICTLLWFFIVHSVVCQNPHLTMIFHNALFCLSESAPYYDLSQCPVLFVRILTLLWSFTMPSVVCQNLHLTMIFHRALCCLSKSAPYYDLSQCPLLFVRICTLLCNIVFRMNPSHLIYRRHCSTWPASYCTCSLATSQLASLKCILYSHYNKAKLR